ncbi:MAG: tripartite tricarboxylate transporter substrate-binding protein, partial [Betaproteobacteria bacterium]
HSGQLPFDYQAFDAVARALVESVVVAVRTDARWRNLGDFVQDLKAKPKGVSVGHSGVGSHTHISLAALLSAVGAQANEVPFGAAQVVPSLVGGHVDAVVQLPAALAAPVKQNQARLLASG